MKKRDKTDLGHFFLKIMVMAIKFLLRLLSKNTICLLVDGRKLVTVIHCSSTCMDPLKKIDTTGNHAAKEWSMKMQYIAPDGGYAWVIVAQAFLVSILTDGSSSTFGVFLPIYMSQFNQDAANIAWIGSISSFIGSALGIVSGYYSDRYGNRKVLAFGTIFLPLGFFLAGYSNTLWQLFITQGLIFGFGYG
jgi:hypothetical protein